MKLIPLITLGLFFLMKLSAARYLLVEIEDGVVGKIHRHPAILIQLFTVIKIEKKFLFKNETIPNILFELIYDHL